MKVSAIWRILAVFVLGVCLGLLIAFTYTAKNTPTGTSVEIGKLKIKGRDNTIETTIDISNPDQDPEGDKKKRRRRK